MSNANLGESTPPVNDKSHQSAEINNPPLPVPSVPPVDFSQFMTRQDLINILRAMMDGATDHLAAEKILAKPPIVAPAAEAKRPVKHRPSRDEDESRAIQALVALQMQHGRLPSAVAICQATGFGRGKLYTFEKWKAIYFDLKAKEKEERRRGATAVREVRGGFRTTGGGLEAVDFDDDFDGE